MAKTELGIKASKLKMNMHLTDVLEKLGTPKWLFFSGESSNNGMAPDNLFMLVWPNLPYFPVAVHIALKDNKLTGWTDGTEIVNFAKYQPANSYLLTHKKRKNFYDKRTKSNAR